MGAPKLEPFGKLTVLNNNHDVRNKNYNAYSKNNYFEFQIPFIEDFDARHYSPLVYEEIPYLERGTLAYDDFWDEQDRRCIEGYAPIVDGVQYPRITGPHYFYLNILQIRMLKKGERKKKLSYPYYRVLDHLIFLEIEKAEFLGYGLIIGKARRMGLSYIGDCMILWNLIFHLDNEVAIGAGKEDKATELYDKVVKSIENLREEYKFSYRKNKTELKLAYKNRVNKVDVDEGINSSLTVKTFFADPSAFEGGSYSFFIFEEIGLQDNLIKSYKASEPCFMEGGIQFGVPMLYGTGGEVDKGSKDMKTVYENPRAYNLKKLFIPAYMYYPGFAENEEEQEVTDELQLLEEKADFFDPKTGRTDEEKALAHILKRRKMASKSREGYIKEVQSRPIKESDLFLKTSGGVLNRLLLNAQLQRINDKNDVAYEPKLGRLEWIYDPSLELRLSRCHTQKERDKVHMMNGSKVKFVEDPDGTVYIIAPPINDPLMPYLADIAGTDSYDQTTEMDSGSLGATMVYRVFNGTSRDYNMPVGLVYEKSDASSDDTFYSNSLKLCVYFRTKTLAEYSKVAIINYFEDCMAQEHLALKPILRNEDIANKGRQTYGVHMTKQMKENIVTKLLKHEVNNNSQNIWLDLIILDLIEYGDENTDIAMAYGMCLVQKLDMFDEITEDLETYDEGDVLMDMEYYTTNSQGELVMQSYGNAFNDSDIETFDPRKHLEGIEREKYINFMANKRQKLQEERERLQQASMENIKDPFLKQVEDELLKRQNYDL